jgi:hypothetical protein
MPKSVTRTVRLDDDLDAAIRGKAKEANTSVNVLVNRLIRKYVDWDLPGQKFGLGPVATSLLNRLFENVDDKSAFDLGRAIAHDFYKPFACYLFGELTLDTSIHLFRRAADYGGRYSFDVNTDKKHRILVLRHNGGQRVSQFYSGVVQGVYSEILKTEVKVESNRDYLVVQLPPVTSA